MGVNSLPKTVIPQRCDCDLNPSPSATESSTLTTRLPSHPTREYTSTKTPVVLPPKCIESLSGLTLPGHAVEAYIAHSAGYTEVKKGKEMGERKTEEKERGRGRKNKGSEMGG